MIVAKDRGDGTDITVGERARQQESTDELRDVLAEQNPRVTGRNNDVVRLVGEMRVLDRNKDVSAGGHHADLQIVGFAKPIDKALWVVGQLW